MSVFKPYPYYKDYEKTELNAELKILGFNSFKSYLSSNLFQTISSVVFSRDLNCCRNPRHSSTAASQRQTSLAKEIGLLSYHRATLLGLNCGMIFSLCANCAKFCTSNTVEGKPDLETVRKRVRLCVMKVKRLDTPNGNPLIGAWFREQFEFNKETVRQVFQQLEEKEPKFYALTLTLLETGDLANRYREYLGLDAA